MSLSINSILSFTNTSTAIESYHLAEEKCIRGNPLQSIQNHYSSECDQFHSGVWSSEAGVWSINYTEHEYCEILEGSSIISDESGNSLTVSTGDRFIIPAGFKGSWEVVGNCRKIYVIFEQK